MLRVVSNQIIIRDVPFTLPNATGSFTITDTGGPAGLTPKACIIVLSGSTTVGDEVNPARISMGMTDGTDAIAMSWMAEHGVLAINADTGRRRATNKILNITITTNQTLQVGATFTSVGVNALTINLDTASTLKGWVRFMYGANLSAKVLTFSANTTQDVDTTSPSIGFQADGAIFMSARNAWNTDIGFDNVFISIGCAGRLSSLTQACIGIGCADLAATTSTAMKPRNDRILSIMQNVAGVVSELQSIELKTFDADTITVTTRDGGGVVGIGMLALSLNGEKCYADLPTLDTDATGLKSYTTPGFQTRALFFVGSAAATANTLDQSVGAMSVGIYSPATVGTGEFATKWNDADAQTTSISTCAFTENQFVHVESKWAGRVNRITATGFDYDVLVANGGADYPTMVFSIGEQPPPFKWGRRFMRLGRSLAHKHAHGQAAGARHATTRAPVQRPAPPKAAGPKHGLVQPGGARHATVQPPGQHPVSPKPAGVKIRLPIPGTRGKAAAHPVEARAAQSARARPGQQGRAVGGKAAPRFFGAFLREITRFRLARLMRVRWAKPLEPNEETPTAVGVPTDRRGSNALAGSQAGDNALAGAERGS